jgi:hypothetical protein
MPLAPTAPLPEPGVMGRVLGGLFFAIALVIFGFGLYNAAHAAGVVGTHGTLAVERCWVDRGISRHSRDTPVCGGTFRSDNGKIIDDQASIRDEVKPGSEVSVQQAGEGYLRVGFAETTRWIAMFFLGWLVVAFGMSFAATGMFPRNRAQVIMITRAVSDTRVGKVRRWFVRAGLSGTGVCLVLTLLA